ncbi:lipocalin-like domain-containing protein [Vibrio crassostreae]|uniref:lipocalin-like domain-containing protein n=1 Tax=Vibrio crassostreae TaxID=246167 RepID=UPI001B312C53|nr:lipocalin-like domain-containing protein [Vibrio crassostreae]
MDKAIIGTWGLKQFTLIGDNENDVTLPFGESPDGQIIYTEDGFMSVALHSSERPSFSSDDILSGSNEEFIRAMQTYSSYAGRVVVEEKGRLQHIIEHSLFPNWVGHSEEREYTVEGNQLTLKTPPFFIAGAQRTGIVIFEKRT